MEIQSGSSYPAVKFNPAPSLQMRLALIVSEPH